MECYNDYRFNYHKDINVIMINYCINKSNIFLKHIYNIIQSGDTNSIVYIKTKSINPVEIIKRHINLDEEYQDFEKIMYLCEYIDLFNKFESHKDSVNQIKTMFINKNIGFILDYIIKNSSLNENEKDLFIKNIINNASLNIDNGCNNIERYKNKYNKAIESFNKQIIFKQSRSRMVNLCNSKKNKI